MLRGGLIVVALLSLTSSVHAGLYLSSESYADLPAQWRGFLLDHNLRRGTQALEGHHGSVFYYPVVLFAGTMPWSSINRRALLVNTTTVAALRHSWRMTRSWSSSYLGNTVCNVTT